MPCLHCLDQTESIALIWRNTQYTTPYAQRTPKLPWQRMSMRKRLTYSLLFFVLLALALLSQWPAASLASLLQRASNDQWRLTSTSGSIWRGAGMLMARAGQGAPWRNVQNLSWQVRPLALLRGRLVIDLLPEQGQLRLTARPSGLQAEQLEMTLPAEAIAPFLPGAIGRYDWHGMLQLNSTQFACNWDRSDCHGQLQVAWQAASVAEIPGITLGDYQILLNAQGAQTQLQLETLQGRLQLTGEGVLTAATGLNFTGLAALPELDKLAHGLSGQSTAAIQPPQPLAELLATLGRPDGQGRYLLEYRQTH